MRSPTWACATANGDGVAEDAEQAVSWYRRAAEAGDAGAQFNLGLCYANGDGVPEDAELSVAWHRRAADAGQSDSQFSLGVCYAKGDGVAKDAEQAVSWYRRAAEAGHARCAVQPWHSFASKVKGFLRMQNRQCRGTAVQLRRATQVLSTTWACATAKGNGVAKDAGQAVLWYQRTLPNPSSACRGRSPGQCRQYQRCRSEGGAARAGKSTHIPRSLAGLSPVLEPSPAFVKALHESLLYCTVLN